MFPEAEPCSVAPAGTDQLDLEAAEQLIQLSGGDGAAADDDDAGSESRSADSVKCRRKKEKEKKAAVENRGRGAGKDGNGGGESDIKGVDSSACSATAADVVEKDNKVVVVESNRRRTAAERFPAVKDRRDVDGGILHGEARKRPRYRSLADIYRETEPRRLTAGGGDGDADRDPPEGDRRKEEEKKSGRRGVVAAPSMQRRATARRSVQLAHRPTRM